MCPQAMETAQAVKDTVVEQLSTGKEAFVKAFKLDEAADYVKEAIGGKK